MNGERTNNPFSASLFSWSNIFWSLRPVNILIVAATQYVFYYFLFKCNASNLGLVLELDGMALYLFIATTVTIAICGYLINDYIDFESDVINLKQNKFRYRWLYMPLYFGFLILGLCFSFFVALKLGRPLLVSYYLLASSLLFLYSTHFKKMPLLGNIVVALFSASVVLVFFIFESMFLSSLQLNFIEIYTNLIFDLVFYALFIFVLSLVREIVKDLEDVKGDKVKNDITIAVKNFALAKNISVILSLFLGIVELVYILNMKSNIHMILGFVFILIPQTFFLYKLIQSHSKKEFNFMSSFAKMNMILGLIFLVILKTNT